MPEGQQVPSGLAAGLAIFVINGDVTSINCSPQAATGNGINVTVGGLGAAPVAVAGAHGSAIGDQAVQAGRDVTAAEQQAAAARAEDAPSRASWWARLREARPGCRPRHDCRSDRHSRRHRRRDLRMDGWTP